MLITLLCIGIPVASIGVGIALGRFLSKCEDNNPWNANTGSKAMNQTAPGADWGTWS